MPRPRKLSAEAEAALLVMKRAGAPNKTIMHRFGIGKQAMYDVVQRAQATPPLSSRTSEPLKASADPGPSTIDGEADLYFWEESGSRLFAGMTK